MKTYVGFSRDHSGSMRSLARAAARDYNNSITSLRSASTTNNQDTVVSVVECGYGNTDQVRRIIVNSSVNALETISESAYCADGRGTPLFDSVGELIEIFQSVPDASDKDVSFLIMATTDGHENASRKYSAFSLAAKIRELELTDRWTFVFRCPRGYARDLMRMGIAEGNILEWDQTQRGVEVASKKTEEAFTQYMTLRSAGGTSTRKFYADLTNVTAADIAVAMTDISSEVQLFPVGRADNGEMIREFVEAKTGKALLKGAAFYQLTKTEPEVQDHKIIAVRDKQTGAVYSGPAARQMLGLPTYGTIRLAPGNFGNFELFIQSTSVNRKLAAGTTLLYWPNVGSAYKEGKSAAA